ncbi:MAG: hypothetical protein KAI47_17835 [Deltaproteobacteria bacterium]|nr:hypothetical protein [Deltaproteobacteria bacterium]
MMRIATLTLLLAALAGGACYNPDLSGDPGPFKCTNADPGSCPPNYACDIAKNVCVKKSTTHDAAPGDQKVADVTAHETAPDAAPQDLAKADAPTTPALVCALGNPKEIGNTAGGSTVGLAYDDKEKALYASYVVPISKSTNRRLLVRQAILGTSTVKMVVNLAGTFGLDTAVAAQDGQWIVVYQEEKTTSPKTQNFMARRSQNSTQEITLSTGYAAGQQPDVILLPNNGSFAAAHALAPTQKDFLTPKGEAIRVMFPTLPDTTRYASTKSSTGFDNNLAINPTTHAIYYAMLAKNATATTALIAKSPFATPPPTPQEIALGKLPTFLSGNAPGLDIAWPRLVATAKPQIGNANSEIQYRPDLSKSVNVPVPFEDTATLTNLGRPRIAARDGMVAVSAVDAQKNLWITVQDEKTATKPWSPALKVSTSIAIDQIVATPGSNANEVIFQILYRDTSLKKALHLRTLTCKRST